MNVQLNSLISNLVSETQSNRIHWSASGVRDEFRLDMPSGVLLVSSKNNPAPCIALKFFRGLGDEQTLCEAKSTEPDYATLWNLYSCVQRSFFVTIDSLMSELAAISKK